MRSRNRLLPLLLLLLAAGCAGAGGSSGLAQPARDSRVLGEEEILSSHASNALEVVRQLRPIWLRKRGQMSLRGDGEIMVYVDNMPYGSIEWLRSVPSVSVESMQFFDAGSATQRWGTNHVHGAILVRMRSR